MQAVAVRAVLPGPTFGENPDVDRPYAAARVRKALAGTPSAAAARAAAAAASGRGTTSSSGSSGGDAGDGGSTKGVLLPWQAGADDVAAEASLQLVLKECDALGPPAEWIRYVCV